MLVGILIGAVNFSSTVLRLSKLHTRQLGEALLTRVGITTSGWILVTDITTTTSGYQIFREVDAYSSHVLLVSTMDTSSKALRRSLGIYYGAPFCRKP